MRFGLGILVGGILAMILIVVLIRAAILAAVGRGLNW